MQGKRISFVEKDRAELVSFEIPEVTEHAVKVKTVISTVSPGTEKANIMGDANIAGPCAPKVSFPRYSGYSSSGVVVEVGSMVTGIQVGDRVHVYQGTHNDYNVVDESRIVKIPDGLSFEEAALAYIITFPMAAIRKCRLEMGESALVMGLGLLGQLAVRLLRIAGAMPVIGIDPVESRRRTALSSGADYAFNPFDADFVNRVKYGATEGGANVAIEVTGVGAGLDETLDCMKRFGRVALLGCTRNKDFTIDYYRKIHCPGITLVGAHTAARPDVDSYPGYFTQVDDIKVAMRLIAGKRLTVSDMLGVQYSPADCTAVYNDLIHNPDFPPVVQFNWTRLGE